MLSLTIRSEGAPFALAGGPRARSGARNWHPIRDLVVLALCPDVRANIPITVPSGRKSKPPFPASSPDQVKEDHNEEAHAGRSGSDGGGVARHRRVRELHRHRGRYGVLGWCAIRPDQGRVRADGVGERLAFGEHGVDEGGLLQGERLRPHLQRRGQRPCGPDRCGPLVHQPEGRCDRHGPDRRRTGGTTS